MKRKPLLSNCLLVVAVLILSGIAPVQAGRDAAASKDKLITVLNPAVTEKLAERVPLAPRLDTLEGKTIYLVDMNYEGFGRTACARGNAGVVCQEHARRKDHISSSRAAITLRMILHYGRR